MFEAKLVQGALLKNIFESIKELVSDANFECTEDGISLQAMDNLHISLVHLLLKSNGFAKYRCNKTINLGINLPNLSKMLKSASNDDTITIQAEEDTSSATFIFENEKKQREAKFEIKLTNIEVENIQIPDSEYAATVQMPSREFQKIVKDLSAIGDTINISCTKGSVRFTVQGESGSGSINVKQNSSADNKSEATLIDMAEPVSLTFGLKYLIHFTKSTSLSDSVVLQISKEHPLVVSYKFADYGYIKYYLAPKLEDDEDEQQQENGNETIPKEEPEDEDDE